MAAVAAPVTTAEVVALQDRLTRFVFASFHRKLSFDEASDAAAEALAEADRAVARGQQIADLNAWLCTAAWRNAISMVRRLEGEGNRKRVRPVDISEHGEWLLDERSAHDDLIDADGKRADRQALAQAWSTLKSDEQRALYLRYFDELPVDEVLALLGCSRHHYENLTKRGVRKLREALVSGAGDAACRTCRAAIVESRLMPLDDARIAARDAHVSACLACRAFERRQRGLIAALPLPAVGLLDRIAARVQAVLGGGDVTQPSEAAAGTVALAGAGTGAGAVGAGSAAGGLLTAGGVAKALAVVCSAGAVTAGVCATAVPSSRSERKEPRAAAARTAMKPKPRRAAARPLVPVTRSVPRAPVRSRPATPPATPSGAPLQESRAAARAARSEAARKASSPFLPESAAPPSRHRAAAPPRPQAATFSSTEAPTATPAPSPRATPSERAAFSEEFTP
jgi:RNA polymerase sigma factor (sigma-70 family)